MYVCMYVCIQFFFSRNVLPNYQNHSGNYGSSTIPWINSLICGTLGFHHIVLLILAHNIILLYMIYLIFYDKGLTFIEVFYNCFEYNILKNTTILKPYFIIFENEEVWLDLNFLKINFLDYKVYGIKYPNYNSIIYWLLPDLIIFKSHYLYLTLLVYKYLDKIEIIITLINAFLVFLIWFKTIKSLCSRQ